MLEHAEANREARLRVGGSPLRIIAVNSGLVPTGRNTDALPRNYESIHALWGGRGNHNATEAIEARNHAIADCLWSAIHIAVKRSEQ